VRATIMFFDFLAVRGQFSQLTFFQNPEKTFSKTGKNPLKWGQITVGTLRDEERTNKRAPIECWKVVNVK